MSISKYVTEKFKQLQSKDYAERTLHFVAFIYFIILI